MNVWDRWAGPARITADVVLGAVFAGMLAFTAAAIADSWGGDYWLFDCAAGVVVSLIALARRIHRAWMAVAGLAVAAVAILAARLAHLPHEPGPAATLGLAVLVGSSIRVLSAPWASAIAAGGLAVVVGSWLSGGFTPMPVLSGAAFLAAVAIGLGLRLFDTRRRATVEGARRDERLELARELHDAVAHHVTGIVVAAQAAQLVARKHPDRLNDSLTGIETAGSDALAAMRRVVGLLRDTDDAAPATPGPEHLGELVKRFDGHGPAVHLRMPEGDSAWPPEVTSTVYRIVQESLTNVSRHAPHASSVTVSVAEQGSAVTVEVVDDAPKVPARHSHRGGYGLIGMRERVETLGGTLRAGPRPEAGWSVQATLPISVRESR